MSKFKSKSSIILRKEKDTGWSFKQGQYKVTLPNLYRIFLRAFREIEDKDKIVKVNIEVFRKQ